MENKMYVMLPRKTTWKSFDQEVTSEFASVKVISLNKQIGTRTIGLKSISHIRKPPSLATIHVQVWHQCCPPRQYPIPICWLDGMTSNRQKWQNTIEWWYHSTMWRQQRPGKACLPTIDLRTYQKTINTDHIETSQIQNSDPREII